MEYIRLTAPCHFGLESVLKREIYDLGYEIEKVEDGRVTFLGDAEAICRANIHLRTADRVLIEAGTFRAASFEELFEGVRAIPWENYLPKDARFPVTKASSVGSRLCSLPDIQSITKKAVVSRLSDIYHVNWFDENGAEYPIRVFLHKDNARVMLDSTGVHLHRRGYRTLKAKAPITETLAAGLIMLTPWRRGRILADPFCGSGTFVIEAAMMAAGIAPGAYRSFTAQQWENVTPASLWNDCFEEAREEEDRTFAAPITGTDIDPAIIRAAKDNARRAGVGKLIRFAAKPVKEFFPEGEYGFLITNPPYGTRLEDETTLPAIYREMGEAFRRLPTWSKYVITAYEDAQRYIGKNATKNRKIYNGMLMTRFYQYPGPKPPKGI